MPIERPAKIHTVALQSLGKKTRVVEVEIIPSADPGTKPHRRKRKSKAKPSAAKVEKMQKGKTPTGSPRKVVKTKTKRLQAATPDSTKANAKLKEKTKSGKRSAGVTGSVRGGFGEGSAGLPGNEELDPPRRSSGSTPASRWLDQIKR